jgi:hypothetical protein
VCADYIVGADIEDNVADYNIVVDSTFDLTLVNNTAQHIDVSSDYATTGNVNFKPTVISGNRVDADIQAHYMKNITATNNVGAPAVPVARLRCWHAA